MPKKDEKYIQRLKGDIANLQQLNKRLEAKLAEAIGHLQSCDNAVRMLTQENSAGRRIIWAAAHSLGGRLEIPDSSMRMAADDSNQITSTRDPENLTTVIEAKTEPVLRNGKPELDG